MPDVSYNSFARDLMTGAIVLGGDNLKVMLVTSSYRPDKARHTKRADVNGEAVGRGYTAGGAALTGVSVTIDGESGDSILSADDTIWTTAAITARGAVVYHARGAAEDDELVRYVDFGKNVTSTDDAFTVFWGGQLLAMMAR